MYFKIIVGFMDQVDIFIVIDTIDTLDTADKYELLLAE